MPTKSEKLLADLQAASKHLRDTDAPALADTVDSLLAPKGWGQLRRAVEAENTPPSTSFSIGKTLKVRYQQASKTAGSNLTDDATEGLEKLIAGEFSPASYPRRQAGSGEETHLNVRIPADLKAEAAQVAKQTYGTTLGHVVKAYLAHKYPAPPAE
ncbi:hypothetical protein [Streptomyces cinereoruber]|uniref:hypothetical protein n=1 Tax=Streptomyces cinereoruber TaxID=67260 RepID=UPI0036429D3F